ncbi:hypothetical protein SDC9_152767 [bioreactor metagenome]|uniref:Uncharacterized protein n=1 Tax=bioreactor metagenome TaxID=1076179 RepID=A0A645EVR4_9ZZZZ
MGLQNRGQRPERVVAGHMPEAVVDLFEIVDIHDREHDGRGARSGLRQTLQVEFSLPPVVEAGKHVRGDLCILNVDKYNQQRYDREYPSDGYAVKPDLYQAAEEGRQRKEQERSCEAAEHGLGFAVAFGSFYPAGREQNADKSNHQQQIGEYEREREQRAARIAVVLADIEQQPIANAQNRQHKVNRHRNEIQRQPPYDLLSGYVELDIAVAQVQQRHQRRQRVIERRGRQIKYPRAGERLPVGDKRCAIQNQHDDVSDQHPQKQRLVRHSEALFLCIHSQDN